MIRPIHAALLVIALVAASCSGETAETTTSSIAPTTTTTTTTTTLPPVSVENAPPELAAVIDAFYEYAASRDPVAPPMVEPVMASIAPTPRDTPATGVASVAAFKGQGVATVETGGDLFLLVDDGTGWRIVGGAWPSLEVPAYLGGAPRLVAVVGSDARPGEDMATARADSIHFIGLDGAGSGAVVGVPRDAWVVGPSGGRGKITNVLANHGPDALFQTFKDLTGLPLEGYVLSGFVGFQEMLGNVLGGIVTVVPFAINDRWAYANLPAGEQYLNGPAALSFARARKTVPGGDFTRSSHQGIILIDSARTVKKVGYGAIPGLLAGSEQYFITNLTPEQLLTFSAMAISANLDAMPNIVAPGSVGTAGAASVVFLASSAANLWADLADGRLEE